MRAIKARLSKFQTVEDYIHGWGHYYYSGGILLPTRKAEPVGTDVSLHIQIATEETVLRGEGVVQEVRTNSEGAAVGMVIRFTRLDARSKDLIGRILHHKRDTQTSANLAVVASSPRAHESQGSEAEPVGASEIGAIAEALEETFDAIFSGSFSAVAETATDDPTPEPPAEGESENEPDAHDEDRADNLGADAESDPAEDEDSQADVDEDPDSADESAEDPEAQSGAGAGRDAQAEPADAEADSQADLGDDASEDETSPDVDESTPDPTLTPQRTPVGRSATVDAVNEVLGRIGLVRTSVSSSTETPLVASAKAAADKAIPETDSFDVATDEVSEPAPTDGDDDTVATNTSPFAALSAEASPAEDELTADEGDDAAGDDSDEPAGDWPDERTEPSAEVDALGDRQESTHPSGTAVDRGESDSVPASVSGPDTPDPTERVRGFIDDVTGGGPAAAVATGDSVDMLAVAEDEALAARAEGEAALDGIVSAPPHETNGSLTTLPDPPVGLFAKLIAWFKRIFGG